MQRLFASKHTDFFLHASDTVHVKLLKIKAMVALVSPENALASIREFKVISYASYMCWPKLTNRGPGSTIFVCLKM